MLFDPKEVRSELMRIFSVEQLSARKDLNRDKLIIEERGGKYRVETVEGEQPKNKWNLFNLRDQLVFNTEVVVQRAKSGMGKSSMSFLSYFLVNLFFDKSQSSDKAREGNNQFKTQQNNADLMKMSHYFLFNKMTINSIGTYLALLTENVNDNMIVIVNLKTYKQFSLKTLQEIVSFNWHPIEACCFCYSTQGKTKHFSFSQDNETTFHEVATIDHYTFSSISKWITAPNGQMSLLLTKSHIEIYDIAYKSLYAKTFAFKSFINALFAPNCSFFAAFTEDEIFIFNSFTLDFKSYSNFPGSIKELLITESSNYIYALIAKGNDILLYIIYSLSEDNYNLDLYQSYNNPHLAYVHSTYKMHYNVYQLLVKIQQLERAELSADCNRLALLYKSDMGERYLCLYDISNGNSVHHFSIQPLMLFEAFKGYSIKDFTMGYDYALKLNVIYLNWTDRFISKTIINAPMNRDK